MTCGPDMVTPEDGLAVGSRIPEVLCSVPVWTDDCQMVGCLSSVEVCAESGGLVFGGELSVGLRSTIGS